MERGDGVLVEGKIFEVVQPFGVVLSAHGCNKGMARGVPLGKVNAVEIEELVADIVGRTVHVPSPVFDRLLQKGGFFPGIGEDAIEVVIVGDFENARRSGQSAPQREEEQKQRADDFHARTDLGLKNVPVVCGLVAHDVAAVERIEDDLPVELGPQTRQAGFDGENLLWFAFVHKYRIAYMKMNITLSSATNISTHIAALAHEVGAVVQR